jgi:hypothetical protein
MDQLRFFLPIDKSSINQQTTLLTKVDDEILAIGYGTPEIYRIYELEELDHSFRFVKFNNPEMDDPIASITYNRFTSGLSPISSISYSGRLFHFPELGANCQTQTKEKSFIKFPIFSRPEEPNSEFLDHEIDSLFILLSNLPPEINISTENLGFIDSILSKIKLGRQGKNKLKVINQQILLKFNRFNHSELKRAKKWLILLFQTGMYIRKWSGSGNQYPILEKETFLEPNGIQNPLPGSKDPIHQQRTLLSILAIRELEEKMSDQTINILRSLTGYNLVRGRIFRDSISLGERIKTIFLPQNIGHQACIRVTSTILIGSGYVYLSQIFDHKISGFDPILIDKIS